MAANLHNTLHVTSEGAYVAVEGESLRVRVDHESRAVVPMHHLVSVVCFGPVGMSPQAMVACAERGISVVFLSVTGKFLARVEGATSASVGTRVAQHEAHRDAERRLTIATAFVAGKVANARSVLLRAARTRDTGTEAMTRSADRLLRITELLPGVRDLDALRGLEGEAAARYFDHFGDMIGDAAFPFSKRTRRPPTDPVNAMLSFGYALLTALCLAAAQAAGLEAGLGFLHDVRAGRPALALDLMEEFRPLLVDRHVLSLIRLGQATPEDFQALETGEVRLSDSLRKTYLSQWQRRLSDKVTHPLLHRELTWAEVPHVQARLLARAVRGETAYLPMLSKA